MFTWKKILKFRIYFYLYELCSLIDMSMYVGDSFSLMMPCKSDAKMMFILYGYNRNVINEHIHISDDQS